MNDDIVVNFTVVSEVSAAIVKAGKQGADKNRAGAESGGVVNNSSSSNPLPGYHLVDTRTEMEYAAGSIPAAIGFHWKNLFKEDGNLLHFPAVQAKFVSAGLNYTTDPQVGVVLYCAKGVRAAFMYMYLHHMGGNLLKLYPGSYAEWQALGGLTITHYHE